MTNVIRQSRYLLKLSLSNDSNGKRAADQRRWFLHLRSVVVIQKGSSERPVLSPWMQTIHVDLSHCKLRWWIIVLNKGSIENNTWWSLVVILSQRYQSSHSLVLQMNYTWSLAVKSSAAISTKLQPVSSSFSQPSPWISILLGQRTRSTMNASDFLPHQTFIIR